MGDRHEDQRDEDQRPAHHPARPDVAHRLQADPGPDGDPEGQSDQECAGLEGRLAEHELEVLRQPEDHPEHGEERQRDRAGSGREPPIAEE